MPKGNGLLVNEEMSGEDKTSLVLGHPMMPEQQQALNTHVQAIAETCINNSDPKALQALEGIEVTIRSQLRKHVSPELGVFFIKIVTGKTSGKLRQLKSTLGDLVITAKQAHWLEIQPYRQISPYYLENCCPGGVKLDTRYAFASG